jgi:Leucine-rich repeat (LRR) protein
MDGATVFATQWPLAGSTKISLSATSGSDTGPLINAGEIFQVLTLGRKTHTGDVIALEDLKKSFNNYPIDWSGDPCFPTKYSWSGVTCLAGPRNRIVALNLTSMGLTGLMSPGISRLTALQDIWLGNNSLSGSIPDLSKLRMLETLHLEDNQFSGEIPSSLGNITGLHELFLQNNNLTGEIPNSLLTKPGLDLRTSGNNLSTPSA